MGCSPYLPILRNSFRTEGEGGGDDEDGVKHGQHDQDFSETISDIAKCLSFPQKIDQAGAELGQAQLKLGLDLNSNYLN